MLPANSVSAHSEIAIKRCEELIARYDNLRNRHRIAYHSFQVASIVLSGITPVLILWTDLSDIIKALPAALAAIATGLIGIFQWRESYPRCTYVCEALRSELNKFKTRSTNKYAQNLDDQQAINNFVIRIEDIVLDEMTDWRTQTQRAVDNKDNTQTENDG
jgi:hypothetical protein